MMRVAARLAARPGVVAALLCLTLATLSLVMTYPLVTDFTGSVLGPPGDNFEYVYKLWWFEHAGSHWAQRHVCEEHAAYPDDNT